METVTGFEPTRIGLGGQGRYPIAINPEGVITGFYIDGGNVPDGSVDCMFGFASAQSVPMRNTSSYPFSRSRQVELSAEGLAIPARFDFAGLFSEDGAIDFSTTNGQGVPRRIVGTVLRKH